MRKKLFKLGKNPLLIVHFGDGALFDIRFRFNNDCWMFQFNILTVEFIVIKENLNN